MSTGNHLIQQQGKAKKQESICHLLKKDSRSRCFKLQFFRVCLMVVGRGSWVQVVGVGVGKSRGCG